MVDMFMPLLMYMIYKDGAPINKATEDCKIPEGISIEYTPIPCAVCGEMPRFVVREERGPIKEWHYVEHKCNMNTLKIKLCPFIKEAIHIIKPSRSRTSAIAITKWNAAQRYIAKLAERIV